MRHFIHIKRPEFKKAGNNLLRVDIPFDEYGIPDYKEAGKIQLIRKYGELQEEEYREDGIFVRAFVPAELYGQVRPEGVTPNNCL